MKATVCAILVFLSPLALAADRSPAMGMSIMRVGPSPDACDDSSCKVVIQLSSTKDAKGKERCIANTDFDHIDVTRKTKPTMDFTIQAMDGYTYEFDDPSSGHQKKHHGAEPNKTQDPPDDLEKPTYGGQHHDDKTVYEWHNKNSKKAHIGIDFFIFRADGLGPCDAHDPVVFNTGQ